ncbi:MAG: zinc metalloprotease HtpX [Thermoplasmatota archaeon]
MSTLWLQARLTLAVAVMFALIYGFITLVAYLMGAAYPVPLAALAVGIVILQYVTGPKVVEATMQVRYIDRGDHPELYDMVQRLSQLAGLPMPRVGISKRKVPNAFAFGRSKKDGRVCVTEALLERLNREELEAVLAHEISHLRHRDMVVITMLSVVPLICYFTFWTFLFGRGRRGSGAIIAVVAFGLYLVTNLIVLYVSRIREYYADQGGAELTGRSHALASALYRITLDTTRVSREERKKVAGTRAFLATDPSRAEQDVTGLRQADLDMDGHLDSYEVRQFAGRARVSTSDRLMEVFSSHPNVVRRIQRLAAIP